MSTLTSAEIAAIWAETSDDGVDLAVTIADLQPGDFLRHTRTFQGVGPRGGRYRVPAYQFDHTVESVDGSGKVTFVSGASVRFPALGQTAIIFRREDEQ